MHLVRLSCLPIVTLILLYCIAVALRPVCESAASAPSSAATVSLVSVPADAVVAVRARILSVNRSPFCAAAVRNAAHASGLLSDICKCRI